MWPRSNMLLYGVLWHIGRSGGIGKEGKTFASRELPAWAHRIKIFEPRRRKNIAQVLRKKKHNPKSATERVDASAIRLENFIQSLRIVVVIREPVLKYSNFCFAFKSAFAPQAFFTK